MPIFENTFIAVYVLVLLFIFGTIFASFIACTAGRVLAGVDWVHGHSHCDTCGHELAIGDLFPIVSYIALKGKCRYCGARVPISCLFTEVLLGVAFVLTAVANPYIDAVLQSGTRGYSARYITDRYMAAQDYQRFSFRGHCGVHTD